MKRILIIDTGGTISQEKGKNGSLVLGITDIVKIVPNNRILVETDAPYLSPVPNRGKRNEPENIWYTANELANIKNIEFEEISRITTENALRLFNI